jgi:hypothetical protein
MSETFQILEHTQNDRVDSVDEVNCIIYGVKVLGEKSRNPPPNDNTYPAETRKKALSLIEGAQVCIDHPAPNEGGRERSYRDVNGSLKEARETGDGARANWHLNPHHEATKQLLWDAKNNPTNLGFSINGDGRRRREGGRMLVEEIRSLVSVDLVSRPATTNGLFEALRTPVKKAAKLLIEELKAKRPGYSRGLREAVESGLMTSDCSMDEPAAKGDPTTVNEGEDHVEAILDAAAACLRDDTLKGPEKIAKIKKLLAMTEKGAAKTTPAEGAGGKGGKGDSDSDETQTEEASRRKQGNLVESLQLQLKSRDLLADAGVKADKILRKALDACKDEAEVKELIEAAKPAAGDTGNGQQVRSAAPTQQHATTPTTIRESQQQAAAQQQPAADPDKARQSRLAALRRG